MSETTDIITAQKIAKFLCGGCGSKDAGSRFAARYVQQSLHYLPMFKPTLRWMLDEKLVVAEGSGKRGEGAKTLGLSDAGSKFIDRFGTDASQLRQALAFPTFVYDIGSSAFRKFGLWCIERGRDPQEVLAQFIREKSFEYVTEKVTETQPGRLEF
jgi:hypothetical protein